MDSQIQTLANIPRLATQSRIHVKKHRRSGREYGYVRASGLQRPFDGTRYGFGRLRGPLDDDMKVVQEKHSGRPRGKRRRHREATIHLFSRVSDRSGSLQRWPTESTFVNVQVHNLCIGYASSPVHGSTSATISPTQPTYGRVGLKEDITAFDQQCIRWIASRNSEHAPGPPASALYAAKRFNVIQLDYLTIGPFGTVIEGREDLRFFLSI